VRPLPQLENTMISQKLNALNVWTPGSDINSVFAFQFWGYVFQWRERAADMYQRRERYRQVCMFLNNLKWDVEAECALFDVYYWGSLNRMYERANHPGHRFFQALQGHVWKFGPGSKTRKKTDKPWKWVTVPNNDNPLAPFKGMHW